MNPARRSFTAALTCFATIGLTLGLPGGADAAGEEYVVRAGDSIYGIANAQGVSVGALMSANDLTITSVILPGQRLTIPGGATGTETSSDAAASSTYTVVAGDSLSGIATRHGIGTAALLAANGLELSSVILPGQHLTVPGGGVANTSSTSSPSNASTYKIVAGDSLSGIASRAGVSLSSLLAVNGLRVDSLILPGRLLQLPAGAVAPASVAPTAPSSALDTHTVLAGNSLSGIAAAYGVRLAELLAVNGFEIDAVILPGQELKLPAGATAPAPPAATDPAGGSGSAPAATGNARIDAVVAFALAQQGKRYAFFTRGPDAFDCSGLTLAAYRQAGIDLVHWSAAQANQGTRVDLDNDRIKAGDLIFQQRHGSIVINHVGMAIDGSRWIQAVGPGRGVRVGPIPPASSISVVRRYIETP